MNIQKPEGIFRAYVLHDGKWRHIYVVRTYYQTDIFGADIKMVEHTTSKGSKTIHFAPRTSFTDKKPAKKSNYTGGTMG